MNWIVYLIQYFNAPDLVELLSQPKSTTSTTTLAVVDYIPTTMAVITMITTAVTASVRFESSLSVKHIIQQTLILYTRNRIKEYSTK